MFVTDIYDVAQNVQEDIGINLHLNIIFSEELQKYFNYKYSYDEDQINLTFEVESGTAEITIFDAQSLNYSYEMNEVLRNHINHREHTAFL